MQTCKGVEEEEEEGGILMKSNTKQDRENKEIQNTLYLSDLDILYWNAPTSIQNGDSLNQPRVYRTRNCRKEKIQDSMNSRVLLVG
jgi:hypothetical protein